MANILAGTALAGYAVGKTQFVIYQGRDEELYEYESEDESCMP
jgi:hypothetical protein